MSLFNTLLRLQKKSSGVPLEDYLTEIFTHILQTDSEVMSAFIKFLNVGAEGEDFYASTQVSYSALEGHHSGSRPDLVLRSDNHLIMIESKVGSGEGYQQLKRYAEHLDKKEYDNRTLIYLTKHYDPKDRNEIFKNCKNPINFKCVQWYQIYQILTPFNENVLVRELQHFLKTNHMSANNQFSPTDILALSNFSKVMKMLENVLDNSVKGEFDKVTGANYASKKVNTMKQTGKINFSGMTVMS
jgi:hypothetical protein